MPRARELARNAATDSPCSNDPDLHPTFLPTVRARNAAFAGAAGMSAC